jgi:hypothetical protein
MLGESSLTEVFYIPSLRDGNRTYEILWSLYVSITKDGA